MQPINVSDFEPYFFIFFCLLGILILVNLYHINLQKNALYEIRRMSSIQLNNTLNNRTRILDLQEDINQIVYDNRRALDETNKKIITSEKLKLAISSYLQMRKEHNEGKRSRQEIQRSFKDFEHACFNYLPYGN